MTETFVGLLTRRDSLTLLEWLGYFAEYRHREVKFSTYQNYLSYLKLVDGELGRIALQELRAVDVLDFYTLLADCGYSHSVRQHVHNFLAAGVAFACTSEILDHNPVGGVPCPKGKATTKPKDWTLGQVTTFLQAARSERLYAAFELLLKTGLRVGECLGLQWCDLTPAEDGDGALLQVERNAYTNTGHAHIGTPKTDRSFRTVALHSGLVRTLEDHRQRQAVERAKAGDKWRDEGWVFATQVGTVTNLNNLRRVFNRCIKRSGVPKIRIHDMRHTYITLARDAGVDVEVVAAMAGQDLRVTLKIYSHVTDARRYKGADRFARFFEGVADA